MTSKKWTLEVIFTEGPDGFLLTDVALEPAASPGVLAAIAKVAGILADQEDGPISGGRFRDGAA